MGTCHLVHRVQAPRVKPALSNAIKKGKTEKMSIKGGFLCVILVLNMSFLFASGGSASSVNVSGSSVDFAVFAASQRVESRPSLAPPPSRTLRTQVINRNLSRRSSSVPANPEF